EVAGTIRRVRVDEAAPAVTRGQVEDDLGSLHHLPGEGSVAQVAFAEVDAVPRLPEVVQGPTGQVVGNANRRPAFHQLVHQMTADEGRPPGNQHLRTIPDVHDH